MNVLDQVKAARRVSTPLIYLACPDPLATIERVMKTFEQGAPLPFVRWDVNSGLMPLNSYGKQALVKVLGADESAWPGQSANPGTALGVMQALPGELRTDGDQLKQRGVIAFMLNPQMLMQSGNSDNVAIVAQGILNLRDLYKGNRRTLIMLGPGIKLPPELAQDVMVFEEPLPDEAELTAIVTEQLKAATLDPKPELVEQAVDAVRAMPAFAAEQITAMSVEFDEKFQPTGLNVDTLWQRKIVTIEQIRGLSVYRGAETFDSIGGLDTLKEFGLRLIRSKKAPSLYVQIDEGEKFFGGLGQNGGPGDNTGVTQDSLGVILRKMEDNGWNGQINVGHAGTAKSLFAKSIANTATKITGKKVLSISLDLGDTKSSKLGDSEQAIRSLMRAVESLAPNGRVYFVMNCNDIDIMPPALKRRFRRGIWMFDLPSKAEREAIWRINLKQYGINPKDPRPDDEGWTGADIRNVCETADALSCPLREAVKYVVIVASTDPAAIDVLKRKADGKFLSANKPGYYKAEYLTEGKGEPDGARPRRLVGREN